MRHLKNHTAALFASLLLLFSPAHARDRQDPAARLTPEKVGSFRTLPSAAASVGVEPGRFDPNGYEVQSIAGREYAGPSGERLHVIVVETVSPSAAYSLLQREAAKSGSAARAVEGLRLLGFLGADSLTFVKGSSLVGVRAGGGQPFSPEAALSLARAFAELIEGEVGFIPPVILHLPEWERKVGEGLGYALTPLALREFAGERPALEAVSFEGGAEAATARYGDARLVIVEFSTPQHSGDNDAAINSRIAELRAAGRPTPSFYKRVGNYSVFVFDAPSEEAAQELASGVRYEKDVRWLGRSPNEDEMVARYYTRTMGGVFVTTLITTGVAILICLGVGSVIGGSVFLYRRTRPGAREAYSDAGGMMRLKLEDLDVTGGGANLLGPKQE